MPTPAPSTTEADIILNKTALALAKSQRLIASWLPPPTASDLAHTRTEAQIEKEENEMFTPVPELLGLGAAVPNIVADGDRRRSELSLNERLRRQLLGRDMAKLLGRKGGVVVGGVGQEGLVKARPLPVMRQRGAGRDEGEEEEEEAGGRSSVGRAKRRVVVGGGMGGDGGGVEEGGGDGGVKALGDGKAGSLGRERGRHTGGSYLDQVLAEKSLKKRKKKKRRKEGAGIGLS